MKEKEKVASEDYLRYENLDRNVLESRYFYSEFSVGVLINTGIFVTVYNILKLHWKQNVNTDIHVCLSRTQVRGQVYIKFSILTSKETL